MTSENKKSIIFPNSKFPKILRRNTYDSVQDSHNQLRKFYSEKNPELLKLNSTSGICKNVCAAAELDLLLKQTIVTKNV